MRAPKQEQFDFDRGERLQLLDEVPIESGRVRDGRAMVSVSAATARSVLRAIESHARLSHQCWAGAATLGREISRSERTVRRAIGYLAELQYVIVNERDGRSPICRVNWSEISLATWKAKQAEPVKSEPQPTSLDAGNPGHCDTNPGHCDTNPGHSVRRSVSKRKEKRTPPYAPPLRDGWDGIGASLRELGVVRWRALLDEISSAGVIDADHAREIIAHYQSRPGAWTPVALVERLRSAHPDTPASELWWTPLKAWSDAQAVRQKVRRKAEDHATPVENWRVEAAIVKVLREKNLEECITPSEMASRQKYEILSEAIV